MNKSRESHSDKSSGMGHQGHAHHDASATTAEARHSHHEQMLNDFKRRFIISSILTIPVLVLSPSIQAWTGLVLYVPFAQYILLALAATIYFYGGYPFLKGLVDEVRKRLPGMMTLIGVALTTAFLYSVYAVITSLGRPFFWELATLTDVMLLGHWIEMRSVLGASRALEKIAELIPKTAHRLRDGELEEVPANELVPGDLIVVRPGERVPADGFVISGEAHVDESLITGESRPVKKSAGDEVVSGSLILSGSLTLKVSKAGHDTYIAQVMRLVKEAMASKTRTQDLADRVAKWLTIIALVAGGITASVWVWLGYPLAFAIERAVTVMVITCPHALGLAIPLVVAKSTAIAASSGVLIRRRQAFEAVKDIDTVVFDKTGTLTKGVFEVTEFVVLGNHDEKEILELIASVESRSEHPIADAIVRYAATKGVAARAEAVKGFESIPGKGVRGLVGDHEVLVVGENYLRDVGIQVPDVAGELGRRGATVVYAIIDGSLAAVIGLSDVIRPEAVEAVKELKRMGIAVVMITGDSEAAASWVARELGIKEFYARVLPHQKADAVKKLREKGRKVAMVGDGVNDAPALVAADVGIAIGAGTDVAIESADIILASDDPRGVPKVVKLARSTYKKMVQNLIWATGYNSVAIPLAAGVLAPVGFIMPPAIGALLMSISTVIVAINAQLLRPPR